MKPATLRSKSSSVSTRTGCQVSVPQRSFSVGRHLVDLLLVGHVLGEVLARRGEHGDEDHPLPPLRMVREQVVVHDGSRARCSSRGRCGRCGRSACGRRRGRRARAAASVTASEAAYPAKASGSGPSGRGEPRRPVEVATQHLAHRLDVLARPPGGVEADGHRGQRCAERFGHVGRAARGSSSDRRTACG